MNRLLLLVAGLAVLFTACGNSSDSAEGLSTARPFSEIQASDFVFEADPLDPGRGIFRVTTTEEAICAIVWGETEALGNFNNSLDMNGTGIIDHNVFLPGAIRGETYFFKVQGSTADGSFFESALASFIMPLAEDDAAGMSGGDAMPVHGDNLALAATISAVSSEFSAGWAATDAIDGDMTTEWSTSGDGNDAFIEIDLGSVQDIAGVEFITRSMADGTAITTTYWVTVDGGDRLGPFDAGSPADNRFQDLQASGQIVRFEAEDTTGGNTGAVEIRVFAPAG